MTFSKMLVNSLPCHACRGHAQEYWRGNPMHPSYDDPGWAHRWVVDFHNAVNRRKGTRVWSYEEAKSYWLNLLQSGRNPVKGMRCVGCGVADSPPEVDFPNIIEMLN